MNDKLKFTENNDAHTQNCIYETDGTATIIKGYAPSYLRLSITVIGYVLTCGLLRLLFHWFPKWHLVCTHKSCPIANAKSIHVKDANGVHFILKVKYQPLEQSCSPKLNFESCDEPQTINKVSYNSLNYYQKSPMIKYFSYKRVRYIWDFQTQQFDLQKTWDVRLYHDVLKAKPLTPNTVLYNRSLYGDNDIGIKITPVYKLIITGCLTPFHVFQLFSCIVWASSDYHIYAIAIFTLSLVFVLRQAYEMRKNERALQNIVNVSSQMHVCRIENDAENWKLVNSIDLVPGDVIEIPVGGCTMYCDAVLLSGNCIVNESSITGESVPITKIALSDDQPSEALFHFGSHTRNLLYRGTSVIQTKSDNTKLVLAVVCRTGFCTAKGEIVRAILYPKPMKFKFTEDAWKFVGFLCCLATVLVGVSFVFMYRSNVELHDFFIRSLDLVTIVVPPILPLVMSVGIIYAQNRLRKQGIYCINSNAINVCGVINLACFDKTGTLTEDGLDFLGVVPLNDTFLANSVQSDLTELEQLEVIECMATCHLLTYVNGTLSGDPLDLKMFLSTKWEFTEVSSNEELNSEMALSAIVRPENSELIRLKQNPAFSGQIQDNMYELGIIKQFPFSSSLQRMSVLTRRLYGDEFFCYTKGAPEAIEMLCRPDTVPSNFHHELMNYTRKGYRVLALAWKPFKIPYLRIIRMHRNKIERNLQFLGLLIMENRLKPATTPVIRVLKDANIRPVMITGDNMLTSLSVARDCEIIDNHDRIIIVSAKPPPRNSQIDLTKTQSTDPALNIDDQVMYESLVEFHYAEDLHNPVTEVVTATTGCETQVAPNNNSKSKDDDHCGSNRMSNTPNPYSISIRMLDRPNVHLAISGKTWSIIMNNYAHLIPKLVVKGTVFARFSPEQKAQVVEALQSVGYYVSMCGDGANDCGALKAAHTGIALSEAEASVASPFISKEQNISCMLKLIKEGRCALATSFGAFKFIASYSLVQSASAVLSFYIGSNLSQGQYFYCDFFIITILVFTYNYTKAYPRLSIEPPNMRLLSTSTLMSLCCQVFICIIIQVTVFVTIQSQAWYIPLFNYPRVHEYANYESTAVFIVTCYQYIILAITFSKGAPYRKSIFTNYAFLLNIICCLILTLFVTIRPTVGVQNLLELVKLPSICFIAILHAIALINFFVSYIFEMVLDGLAFRRRLRHIRQALFPKFVERKTYERIRDEIDRSAGCWPPIIKTASLQALPRYIFCDENLSKPNPFPEHRLLSSGNRNQKSENSSSNESLNQCSMTGGNYFKTSQYVKSARHFTKDELAVQKTLHRAKSLSLNTRKSSYADLVRRKLTDANPQYDLCNIHQTLGSPNNPDSAEGDTDKLNLEQQQKQQQQQ